MLEYQVHSAGSLIGARMHTIRQVLENLGLVVLKHQLLMRVALPVLAGTWPILFLLGRIARHLKDHQKP